MRIKELRLKNFKRFTDLTISAIPESSKLVLLIGSNGSGKSSLFDAFDWLSKGDFKGMPAEANNYYKKNAGYDPFIIINFYDIDKIEKGGGRPTVNRELARKFLGRSSVRIVPRIENSGDTRQISTDQDSPSTYIEHDRRFINDVFEYVNQIDAALRAPVFEGRQADTLEIFRRSIDPLNQSLLKIFGDDVNTTIQIAEFSSAGPSQPAKLIFKKGLSKINYELLSHGEKQVVILLVNFIVRQEFYKNSIIFIDEMDCHLNTALQKSLLEEIVENWIPDDSQLWTASHSLGFIDYAHKSSKASIIDFDALNFDETQEIRPRDELDVYEIAVPKDMFDSILKDYRCVFSENKNAVYYTEALGRDKFLFIACTDNVDVFKSTEGHNSRLGLIDRDYLSDKAIGLLKKEYPNIRVLNFHAFENYIYHPDNIAELGLVGFDKELYKKKIVERKNKTKDSILISIGKTEQSRYSKLKECVKNDSESVTEALSSDDFEVFYPFFDMKNFGGECRKEFQLQPRGLIRTNWFKEQIKKVLTS